MSFNEIYFANSTVCLIGSTNYKARFMDLAKELELKGATVIHTHLFSHSDGYELSAEELAQEERNRESRIRKADYVVVISPDGIIDKNTWKELRYALAANHKKTVVFYPIKIGTHDGDFHADDILSVALIKYYYFDKMRKSIKDLSGYDDYLECNNLRFEFEITRTQNNETLNKCDWVIDVFNGNEDIIDEVNKKYYFDLHPDNAFYPNGKMAVCGKVAAYIFKDNPEKLKYLQDHLLNAVEAGKCNNPISFVHLLNPLWNERGSDVSEKAFIKAADMVYDILIRILNTYDAAKEAENQLDQAIKDAAKRKNGILYLNNYFSSWVGKVIAYNDNVNDDEKIYAVVFPETDYTGFVIENVPKSAGSFESYGYFPKTWRGLNDDKLSEVSGLNSAISCHPEGFLAKWYFKQEAIEAAKILVEISKKKQ